MMFVVFVKDFPSVCFIICMYVCMYGSIYVIMFIVNFFVDDAIINVFKSKFLYTCSMYACMIRFVVF